MGEVDGLHYFSMEYVEDGSLSGRLDGTPWLAPLAAELAEVLARAMDAAHRRGIVHRDLKPANVLLGRADPPQGLLLGGKGPAEVRYQPKVADFGLAKRLDEGGQTQTGMVLGTPCYMAPEQAGGKGRLVGPAADVYALGAILYELLTGRPPLKGATGFETIQLVLSEEPIPPSRLQPKLPRDLETICVKCLHKEPGRRYPTALELAEDLARFRAGAPIRARPVPAWERLGKWARRHPTRAALSGVSVVALVAGVAAIHLRAEKFKAEWEQATYLRQEEEKIKQLWLDGERFLAAGELTAADKALTSAQSILDTQRDLRAADLRNQLHRSLAVVQQRKEEQAQRQEARARLSQFQASLEEVLFHQVQPALPYLGEFRAKTRAAARAGLAVYRLDEASAVGVAPLLASDRACLDKAEGDQLALDCHGLLLFWAEAEGEPGQEPADTKEQARQRAERALNLLARARSLGLETQAYYRLKARYAARARGEKQEPTRPDPAAPARPIGALDWFLTGLESYRAGRYEEASQACAAVLDRQDNHFWARYVLALCHLRSGRWADGKAELTVCVNRRPDFAWPRLVRGFAASELGFKLSQAGSGPGAPPGLPGFPGVEPGILLKEDPATAEFRAAEADFNRALKQDRTPVAQYVGLVNRGVLYVRQQRWQEAVRDLQEAVRISPQGFQAHLNLAQALQGMQRWDEALAALDRAVAHAPALAFLYETRARLQLACRNRAAARADYEQAVRLETDGASERLVNNLVELGRLQHREGTYAAALASYDRALRLRPQFALAQRFRAETLLALDRPGEAGQALDAYLAATRDPPVKVYQARGLIHAQLGQGAAAIEMYTAALRLNPKDSRTRCYRGWAYLLNDAAGLALEDFDGCLRENPDDADALAGRGNARIRLRQLAGALEDASAAEARGPHTDRLLYNLACLYALAAAQAEAEVRTSRNPLPAERYLLYQEKAVKYLQRTLEAVPAERRAVFWREQVQSDPALASLRRGTAYFNLARQYAGQGP